MPPIARGTQPVCVSGARPCRRRAGGDLGPLLRELTHESRRGPSLPRYDDEAEARRRNLTGNLNGRDFKLTRKSQRCEGGRR